MTGYTIIAIVTIIIAGVPKERFQLKSENVHFKSRAECDESAKMHANAIAEDVKKKAKAMGLKGEVEVIAKCDQKDPPMI